MNSNGSRSAGQVQGLITREPTPVLLAVVVLGALAVLLALRFFFGSISVSAGVK